MTADKPAPATPAEALVALDFSGANCPSSGPKVQYVRRFVQPTFADIPLDHYRRAIRKLPLTI